METGIAEFFKGLASLLKGLAITFGYLFRRSITVQYPDERVRLPLRFRGRLALPVDPENGTHRCTACMRCVQACPNHSLDVEKQVDGAGTALPRPARYLYNLGTCMFCNLCVEVCPFFAIVMSDEYELAAVGRPELQRELVSEKYRLTGDKAAWWQRKFREPRTEG
jgi:NADH-quinone oxidoreductase chain I